VAIFIFTNGGKCFLDVQQASISLVKSAKEVIIIIIIIIIIDLFFSSLGIVGPGVA
jgi:hypothetical protein